MEQEQPQVKLARLWMNAQPSVLSFICGAVPKFHDAEDILQQVAEEATENFHQYDPSRPFVAWAIGIARFKVAKFYRSKSGQQQVLSNEALELLAQAHVRHHGKQVQMIDVLEQCMSKLTPKQLALLRLRYSEDLASQEMAHQVGSTAGAIRVMLNRIRTKLLECIDRHASNSRAS